MKRAVWLNRYVWRKVRGDVVALWVPVNDAPGIASDGAVWADLDQLAIEIGAHWPKGVSAVKTVREDRERI